MDCWSDEQTMVPLPDASTAAAPREFFAAPAKHRATVLWFRSDRGYGFIRPLDGGRDVIVHQAAIDSSGLIGLFPGQVLEFELVPWFAEKMRAGNLRLIAAYAD